MFPLAQPSIITASIFNFITIWNEYFMSLIFANKAAVHPAAIGLYNMIKKPVRQRSYRADIFLLRAIPVTGTGCL